MSDEPFRTSKFHLPVDEFFSPLPIISLLGMIINDHYLKPEYHNFLTGILSDFFVLLFFPSLLTATFDTFLYFLNFLLRTITCGKIFVPYYLTKWKVWSSVIISGVILTVINTSKTFNMLYIKLLTVLDVFDFFGNFKYTMDKTDLLALLVLPVSLWWGLRFVKKDGLK